MIPHTLTRTGQTPLMFTGELIACICGRSAYGVEWSQYHNLAVYLTEDRQYVLSIQYRTHYATIGANEQPHDRAVIVTGDTNSLTEEFRRYDPLLGVLHGLGGARDLNYLRQRYQEQVDHLVGLVRIVEEGGASPPLIQPVIVDYRQIDPEIQEEMELRGVEQGISGQEWLRCAIECEMIEGGEGWAPLVVYESEEPEEGDDEDSCGE